MPRENEIPTTDVIELGDATAATKGNDPWGLPDHEVGDYMAAANVD